MYIARFSNEKDQTVQEHSRNVSDYCYTFGKKIGLGATCKLCGHLHDIGKLSVVFQDYIYRAKIETQNGTYDQWVKTIKKVDHGVYGAKYLFQQFNDVTGMGRCARDVIGEVICYHHGGLPDNLNDENEIPLIKRMEQVTDKEMTVVKKRFYEQISEEYILELFEESVQEIRKVVNKCIQSGMNISIGLSFVIKYIYSCLVDSDRLDSYCFEAEYAESNIETEKLWKVYDSNLEKKLLTFSKKKPDSKLEIIVKQMRESISKACQEAGSYLPGIYTLTVPTGGGKTFASMRFALQHAIKYKKKRIIYVMPYTTIVEQNADEIRKTLGCHEYLLEYHSNVLEDVKNEDYEILGDRFTSPIIFTTMVQFLNIIYATGNGNIRKMHQLEDAIIIFDEIQALPIKCTALFYQSINFLSKIAGSTCVLCTATQPNYDYIDEKFKVKIDGEILSNVEEVFQNLKRMNVVDMTENTMTEDEVADFIIMNKQDSQSVLCIMNTVKCVINLFNIIKKCQLEGIEIYALTTRMCAAHRKKIISDIKQALKEKRHVICISTQLIEAGVDISFEKVIRELANLDSIAQAAGRGNRHGEQEISSVYIIRLQDKKLSALSDISIGQKHTRDIFYLYKQEPEMYQNDLLSPQAISSYYKRFYEDNEVNKKMKYPLEHQGEAYLYDLLLNDKNRMKRRRNYELSYTIQFESARKNFEVIDVKTKNIVVPYNKEAQDAIGVLLSDTSMKDKYQILKVLQKYTVNIYENLYRDLVMKRAFIENKMEGVEILSKEYYLSEVGVTGEKELELMMY